MKDSLRKSRTKQNRNKQITRDIEREREPELTHLFKNKSFDISLHREFVYTSNACWLLFYVGSFSSTSGVGFFFFSFLFFFFFSFFSFFLFFFYPRSFPHTSRAGLIFIWLLLFFHLGSFCAGFIFLWGVFLTRPMLPFFFFFFFSFLI